MIETPEQLSRLLKYRDSFGYFCTSQLGLDVESINMDSATITETLAYFLWNSIFHTNRTYLIISPTATISKKRVSELRQLIERMDVMFREMITANSFHRIQFATQCSIHFQSGKNAGKGFSISGLCFDGEPSQELRHAIIPCVYGSKGFIIQA